VELTNPTYARSEMSRTFEGRDRFAPAAAWLALGTPLDALGRPLSSWQTLAIPAPEASGDTLCGEVLVIDHFGNLITNIDRGKFATFSPDRRAIVRLGALPARMVETYAEAGHGELCALFGSSDLLEIAVNGGSAAAKSGAGRGAPVVVMRR
jgi:S-adenosylmethionine hydrolase